MIVTNSKMRKRIFLSFLFLFSLCCLCFFLLIAAHNRWIYIPCLFYKITGFFCPGCGMTRAAYSFFTFDLINCYHNNLLFFIIVPNFMLYIFCLIRYYLLTGNILSVNKLFPRWVWMVYLVIVISFGILRNLEFFDWMQPL